MSEEINPFICDITFEEGEQFELPSYSKPGRILVNVGELLGDKHNPIRREYDVWDYDCDSSVFWISEGIGFDWFLKDVEFPTPGIYVIENITGEYYKGEWGYTDDDEEWNSDAPRLATPEEIAARELA